ncbi:MAG: hypothetical protein KME15_26230 [Drouetiella hepatica Uher 2000/2452]|uniref:Uncharacterized protein n=1 Tax=Drouetiella hepatica Uher 2000/2452 TaxID=904376 RepID=A0A951US50_9CYAN|nr:hypothetical protein [Drouetiella hepatica Uher 2000/2452]
MENSLTERLLAVLLSLITLGSVATLTYILITAEPSVIPTQSYLQN